MSFLRHIVVAVMAVSALTGCEAEPAPKVRPLELAWQEVKLPMPAGTPGRITLRDATVCSGRWFVVGAITADNGDTRPAAWGSADAVTWSAYTFEAISFYGRQTTLYTAACRDGKLAAVGAKRGGAHGNPRVQTWYTRAENVLTEVDAAFGLYGGEHAVSVSRMAAGGGGFVIAGNRTSGAAVWNSPDAREFKILEGTPPLASAGDMDTTAADVTWDGTGWTVVGAVQRTGRIDRDPAAWTSPDGMTWKPDTVPGGGGYDELHRVTRAGDTLVGVGLDGDTFRAWRRQGGVWQPAGRFGNTTGMRPAAVGSATAAGGHTFVTVGDSTSYALWTSVDGGQTWNAVSVPMSLPSANDLGMTIIGSDQQVLLLEEDGKQGRLWKAGLTKASSK